MPAETPDPLAKPRRFYAQVGVAPQGQDGREAFAVTLDGRVAKTPAGGRLVLPRRALAELVAAEWAAQGDTIDLAAMPATRLAATALDRAGAATGGLADEVARYAGSDLLCYFADGPDTLVEQQVAHWGPVLTWAEETLGLHFVRATGVVHQPQPEATVAQVRSLASALEVFDQVGLVFATALFGSAILALALQRGMLTGEAAYELSRLDEAFQEQRWGVDAEAAARTAALRRDAQMLHAWFEALRVRSEVGGN